MPVVHSGSINKRQEHKSYVKVRRAEVKFFIAYCGQTQIGPTGIDMTKLQNIFILANCTRQRSLSCTSSQRKWISKYECGWRKRTGRLLSYSNKRLDWFHVFLLRSRHCSALNIWPLWGYFWKNASLFRKKINTVHNKLGQGDVFWKNCGKRETQKLLWPKSAIAKNFQRQEKVFKIKRIFVSGDFMFIYMYLSMKWADIFGLQWSWSD